jgi:hypothetical protein
VPTAAAQSGRLDLAVLYEHPPWFAAIFAELERRLSRSPAASSTSAASLSRFIDIHIPLSEHS